MSDDDFLPHDIYAKDTDYITVGMKQTTAERLIGWLNEFADFCDLAGNDKTAEHARTVAANLQYEVDADE